MNYHDKPVHVVEYVEPLTGETHALTIRLTMGWAVKAACDFIRTGTPSSELRIRNTVTGEISTVNII